MVSKEFSKRGKNNFQMLEILPLFTEYHVSIELPSCIFATSQKSYFIRQKTIISV